MAVAGGRINHRSDGGVRFVFGGNYMVIFKPGDKVTHITEKWDTPMTVKYCVDQESSVSDPGVENLTFFEEGGFWRTRRLRLVSEKCLHCSHTDHLPTLCGVEIYDENGNRPIADALSLHHLSGDGFSRENRRL
jgi:hypothetical protein